MPIVYAFLVAALATGCGGSQAKPWTVRYADGSANVYTWTRAGADVSFDYDPVTPERSSTGMYSGGDPVKTHLDAGDARLAELWRRVEALEADKGQHTEARAKGTGAFHLSTAEGERSFIIQQGSVLDAFHAFVAVFRQK